MQNISFINHWQYTLLNAVDKDDAQHHVAVIKRKRYYIMKQTDLKHFMNTSKSIQKLVGFLGVWTLLLSAISSSTTVASSLNPLAEDGGAIPPDSPAVAVSALESSVKGIYKKKWTILWLSCPGWLVVIMIHHHCIWNKPICAQSLSTNAKGCWCFGQMLWILWEGGGTHLADTFNMWSCSCKIFNAIPWFNHNWAMILSMVMHVSEN